MMFDIDESDRQLIILALARISLERPGWEYATGDVAQKLKGREMFEKFRAMRKELISPRGINASAEAAGPQQNDVPRGKGKDEGNAG